MGHTENSITINAPIERVFDITNDIARWPHFFTEYQSAEVLSRDGNRITFRLTTFASDDRPSLSWRSCRLVDKANWRATAEREEPKMPFRYMHITWLYAEVPGGTKMTWVQDFQMDPASGYTDEQFEGFINKNTKVQMVSFKEKIEAGAS